MRQSWDYVEEVMQILKTAFPLLIMNMETIVDQISARFKASPEEDIYRLVCMLLQEGLQVCLSVGCYWLCTLTQLLAAIYHPDVAT